MGQTSPFDRGAEKAA